MGKPPWEPTPERIEQVESYAALGLTKLQIAHCMGICYDTLNEKSKNFPAFAEAIKSGQSKGIAMVADALVKNAKKGSVPAQIFFLKARADWKDGSETKANIEHEEKIKLRKSKATSCNPSK